MNAQKIALLTDSCADIPPALCERYGIYVLPLRLLFADGEYLDGQTITADGLYARLPRELPVTSLPSGEQVEAVFSRIAADGYEKVLAVHLSAGLSGTYNLVRLLGGERTDLEVRAFDSVSGSLGIGLVLIQAARLIEQGCDWDSLLGLVPGMIAGTKVFSAWTRWNTCKRAGGSGASRPSRARCCRSSPSSRSPRAGSLSIFPRAAAAALRWISWPRSSGRPCPPASG